MAEQALHSIGGLYEFERQAREMSDEDRRRIRQEKASPLVKALHEWMLTHRDLVPNESATAKALDYSLKRWVALTRYLEDVCSRREKTGAGAPAESFRAHHECSVRADAR